MLILLKALKKHPFGLELPTNAVRYRADGPNCVTRHSAFTPAAPTKPKQ